MCSTSQPSQDKMGRGGDLHDHLRVHPLLGVGQVPKMSVKVILKISFQGCCLRSSRWRTRCQSLAFSSCWVALVEPFSTSSMTAYFTPNANRFLLVVVVVVVVLLLYQKQLQEERKIFPEFTPNLFFYKLLPPIILEAAYALHNRWCC